MMSPASKREAVSPSRDEYEAKFARACRFYGRVAEWAAEEGVTVDHFKLKGLREMFFSKGERAAWCMPAGSMGMAVRSRSTGRIHGYIGYVLLALIGTLLICGRQ